MEEEKPEVEINQTVNVDNGEEIVFDINKKGNIKIVSSKLENKEVEYILVNGIKVTKTTIETKLTRDIAGYSTKEYFIVGNGSIILLSTLFEDLNLDVKEGYNIGVVFKDGEKIADLAKLNIVDTSVNEDNEDNKDKENDNIVNTGGTNTIYPFIFGVILVVSGAVFILKNKKSKQC